MKTSTFIGTVRSIKDPVLTRLFSELEAGTARSEVLSPFNGWDGCVQYTLQDGTVIDAYTDVDDYGSSETSYYLVDAPTP